MPKKQVWISAHINREYKCVELLTPLSCVSPNNLFTFYLKKIILMVYLGKELNSYSGCPDMNDKYNFWNSIINFNCDIILFVILTSFYFFYFKFIHYSREKDNEKEWLQILKDS